MYAIELSIEAAKSYFKLPEPLRVRVDAKLKLIAGNPYAKHNNVKPLKGMVKCFRLRIGNWRVVYEVINNKLKIYIIKIGQRKEVYKS